MQPTLIPAYGRDYKSKKAVLADWNDNKDFDSVGMGGGGYMNKEDAERAAIPSVSIRYKKLTMQIIVEIDPDNVVA